MSLQGRSATTEHSPRPPRRTFAVGTVCTSARPPGGQRSCSARRRPAVSRGPSALPRAFYLQHLVVFCTYFGALRAAARQSSCSDADAKSRTWSSSRHSLNDAQAEVKATGPHARRSCCNGSAPKQTLTYSHSRPRRNRRPPLGEGRQPALKQSLISQSRPTAVDPKRPRELTKAGIRDLECRALSRGRVGASACRTRGA